MTRDEMTLEIVRIIREFRVKPIEPTLESRVLEDLGFDSMSVIELANELEERFDITVPLSDLPQVRTVRAIVDYVERARSSAG